MSYSKSVNRKIAEDSNHRYYKNEKIFKELSDKFNRDTSLIKYVYSRQYDSYRESFDTYDDLSEILSSYGYSEEEIFNYIKHNKELLLVNHLSLLRNLSVLNIANLSEEALFEKPNYLVKKVYCKQLFGSIIALQQEGFDVTLDSVYENIDDQSEYNDRLNSTRLKVLYYNYMKKLAEKKLEIQAEKQL